MHLRTAGRGARLEALAPTPAPGPVGALAALPDGLAYRAKRRFLGDPLHSDELEHQRLGKPTALAVRVRQLLRRARPTPPRRSSTS